MFTGIGTESNYIAAKQRILFELPWEGNAPASDFPLDRKYLLHKFLHRGNLVALMANMAPRKESSRDSLPSNYPVFVGVFCHPDKVLYKHLNNTAWTLQEEWIHQHCGRVVPSVIRKAGQMLDVKTLLRLHTNHNKVDMCRYCAQPGDTIFGRSRRQGTPSWSELPMYFEDNDGNSLPVLVASNGFDKIDANDYMGLSAINMGTALKIANIKALMYVPDDVSCFRALLTKCPHPNMWYELPYNVVLSTTNPSLLYKIFEVHKPYTKRTFAETGATFGSVDDPLSCLGDCVAWAAAKARPDDLGFSDSVRDALPAECEFRQGAHMLFSAKLRGLSSANAYPPPSWNFRRPVNNVDVCRGLLDMTSSWHLALRQRASQNPGRYIFFLFRGIENSGHSYHCYLLTVTSAGARIYSANASEEELPTAVQLFQLVGVAEVVELLYTPAADNYNRDGINVNANSTFTQLTLISGLEEGLQKAISHGTLYMTSRLLTSTWLKTLFPPLKHHLLERGPWTTTSSQLRRYTLNVQRYLEYLWEVTDPALIQHNLVRPMARAIDLPKLFAQFPKQMKYAKLKLHLADSPPRAIVIAAVVSTRKGDGDQTRQAVPIVLTYGGGYCPKYYNPKSDAMIHAMCDPSDTPFNGLTVSKAHAWDIYLPCGYNYQASLYDDQKMRSWLRRRPDGRSRVIDKANDVYALRKVIGLREENQRSLTRKVRGEHKNVDDGGEVLDTTNEQRA